MHTSFLWLQKINSVLTLDGIDDTISVAIPLSDADPQLLEMVKSIIMGVWFLWHSLLECAMHWLIHKIQASCTYAFKSPVNYAATTGHYNRLFYPQMGIFIVYVCTYSA